MSVTMVKMEIRKSGYNCQLLDYTKINKYLTHIFNNVLIIEEATLRTSRFSDVSIKEMHTIDSIGEAKMTTPSDIAKDLMLTVGTVTV